MFQFSILFAGAAAGIVNGLFGAGGGMMLVPILTQFSDLEEQEVFPASVCIILPVCIISLLLSHRPGILDTPTVTLYLLGSASGGLLAGIFGKKIPVTWLHRALGALILWGGIRYLC